MSIEKSNNFDITGEEVGLALDEPKKTAKQEWRNALDVLVEEIKFIDALIERNKSFNNDTCDLERSLELAKLARDLYYKENITISNQVSDYKKSTNKILSDEELYWIKTEETYPQFRN